MRRFDFDTEAVVRLAWRGVTPINIDAPVKYLRAEDGGVSHFRYGRDNALLSWMHLRLLFGFAIRLPMLAARRLARRPPFDVPEVVASGAVATAGSEALSADPLRSSRR